MSGARPGLVATALRSPQDLPEWPLRTWDELVRQARRGDLLARLAAMLDDAKLLGAVPPAPRAHLEAARVFAQAQERDIRREVHEIRAALAPTGVDLVLLKGAAYLMAGLPAAKGRLFADVDILVPRSALPQVEAALMLNGWATSHHNAYDQRYYRQWMHELPPMRHVVRQTVIDVHHAILPLTARLRPDSSRLLEAAIPLASDARVRVLAPVDMVLHSATHLLCNEEFSHGLRDLVDLDALLRHFSVEDGFFERLTLRAAELDLARPLYYALRYATRILGTPVPRHVMEAARIGEPLGVRRFMDALFLRALEVDHPCASDRFSATARRLLYVRGHWLRMPPHLLAWHLAVKAFRREEEQPAQA